jgi:hypothetical protein
MCKTALALLVTLVSAVSPAVVLGGDPAYYSDLSPGALEQVKQQIAGTRCEVDSGVLDEMESILSQEFNLVTASWKADALLDDYVCCADGNRAARFIAGRLAFTDDAPYRFSLTRTLGAIREPLAVDALVWSVMDDGVYATCHGCSRFPTVGDEALRQLRLMFGVPAPKHRQSQSMRDCDAGEWIAWWHGVGPRYLSGTERLPATVAVGCGSPSN